MPKLNPTPNDHVLGYLRYYSDPANEFDFAVLLTGPWGVGKTHLIKNFIEATSEQANKEGRTFRSLYVSLYGMTSSQEIDEELFRQLHLVLASKTMKIGWSILKGSLKAALKIDLEGKDELTVNSSLPEVDLGKYLKTPADALLIFDDLERCSMPIAEVLGYINTFVEHNSYKTIIIANEAELLSGEREEPRDQEDKDGGTTVKRMAAAKSYSLIKEKLIGQTLEVRSSAADAVKTFLQGIKNTRARKFLRKHLGTVLDIHASSGTDNLRLLKHALWDYERIVRLLKPAHWSNEHAMETLLSVALVLSIEIRAGRLEREKFSSLAVGEIVRLMRRGSNNATFADEIADRYPTVSIDKSPLELKHLEALLFEGWVEASDLLRSLDASPYYSSKNEPPSRVAWRGWEVSDDYFLEAVSKIEKQFRNREFLNNGEMLHIFGLRLFFNQIGAISKSVDDVGKECEDCLNDLMKADQIEEADLSEIIRVGQPYCLGHQVMSSETKEFKMLFARYEQLVGEVKLKRLPARGQTLLTQMKADPVAFSQLLRANNVRAAIYWDVPILATIPVKQFVSELLDLSPDAQSTVFASLKSRYDTGLLDRELKPERVWLQSVSDELLAAAAKLPPLSRFRVRQRVAQNFTAVLQNKMEL